MPKKYTWEDVKNSANRLWNLYYTNKDNQYYNPCWDVYHDSLAVMLKDVLLESFIQDPVKRGYKKDFKLCLKAYSQLKETGRIGYE